jgi:hypothetical protein
VIARNKWVFAVCDAGWFFVVAVGVGGQGFCLWAGSCGFELLVFALASAMR